MFGNSGNRTFNVEMAGCYSKTDKVKKGIIKVEFKNTYQTVLLNVDGDKVVGTAVSKQRR